MPIAGKKFPRYFEGFYVHGTVHSNSYVNKRQTRRIYTELILSVNYSTCFGWFLHLSSGAQITVSAASGTSKPLSLSWRIWDSSTIARGISNGWLAPDVVWLEWCGIRMQTEACIRIPHHSSQTTTLTSTHIEPEQYNPWNNSTNESQAP